MLVIFSHTVPQVSSVQSLSCVQLFEMPWTAARQASLSITNSRSPPKPMSMELVMPYNHLILCRPLLLPPSIFPSIRVFSNESALRIKWPKNWSFSFSISPYNEHQDWSPLGGTGWISLQSKGLSRVFSNTTEGSDLAHSLCTLSLALCTWQGNWRYCWMKYDFADIFFTKADSTGPPSPPPERVGKSGLWGLN